MKREMKRAWVLLTVGGAVVGAHSVLAIKFPSMKEPKHHQPVSCTCPQFCWPLPKPQCLSSAQCQLERGRNVQQLFAKRSTEPTVWLRQNIHSDLGSKCQGCSLALSINKSMEWFTTHGGKILCRSSFRPSISGGRREAVRANCVAVCYVRVHDSWTAFRWGCLMWKCHANPKLMLSSNDNSLSIALVCRRNIVKSRDHSFPNKTRNYTCSTILNCVAAKMLLQNIAECISIFNIQYPAQCPALKT